MLPTLSNTNFKFSITFILSSADSFNLDQSKILSFGKGLMYLRKESKQASLRSLSQVETFCYESIFCISKGPFISRICRLSDKNKFSRSINNPFPNKPLFLRACCSSLLKTLREKEKLLVTRNFSFSHSVFYPLGKLSAIFIIFNIVGKLFQFGRV